MSTEDNNQEPNYSDYLPKDETTNESNVTPTPEEMAAPAASFGFERRNEDLIWVAGKVNEVRLEMAKYVIGQHEMVELLMAGIFSNGHILLEGVPGVAKTITAKLLSKTLNICFSRIQFTPDLMPSDILLVLEELIAFVCERS